jgi:hemoglobin
MVSLLGSSRLIAILLPLGLSVTSLAQADDALFQSFGGKPGIDRLVDRFVDSLLADPRVKDSFKDSNLRRLRTQLKSQLCQLTGGPCVYEGRDMIEAHSKLGVDEAQMNALVEDLQDAMRAAEIPFRTQNKLLALLAPMKRDIVTK